jgi:hypothetical protein
MARWRKGVMGPAWRMEAHPMVTQCLRRRDAARGLQDSDRRSTPWKYPCYDDNVIEIRPEATTVDRAGTLPDRWALAAGRRRARAARSATGRGSGHAAVRACKAALKRARLETVSDLVRSRRARRPGGNRPATGEGGRCRRGRAVRDPATPPQAAHSGARRGRGRAGRRRLSCAPHRRANRRVTRRFRTAFSPDRARPGGADAADRGPGCCRGVRGETAR